MSLNKFESRGIVYSFYWIDQNKKATINPNNSAAALNHGKFEKTPQRISRIRPSIDQYKWKEMNFSADTKDWKIFLASNKTFCFQQAIKEGIKQVQISKPNSERGNEVISFLITDSEKWHYVA